MKNERKILILIVIIIMFFSYSIGSQSAANLQDNTLHVFWGDICGSCETTLVYLDYLKKDYPELKIKYYEIYNNKDNHAILNEVLDKRGIDMFGLPVLILNDKTWIGYDDDTKKELLAELEMNFNEVNNQGYTEKSFEGEDKKDIEIPFINKKVNLENSSKLLLTVIISFVDGFNPCSLWVLTFLLGFIIYSGSRRKIFVIGLIFLLTTAIIYGLFMSGVFNLVNVIGQITWLRYMIALLAVLMAVINIKDFFYFKKGISFTIPDNYKPAILKRIRQLSQFKKISLQMILTTILVAGGVTLVELPCTAGFPVLWSNILSSRGVSTANFIILLLIYLTIYLLDELVIFLIAVYSLNIDRLSLEQGRKLKLIGGMLMFFLGIIYLVDYKAMESFVTLIYVFITAITGSFLIMFLHDKISKR